MARVACRWPGGITLHIKQTGVPHERWPTHRLEGPVGPDLNRSASTAMRFPGAADTLRERHLEHLTHLHTTRDLPLHQMDYVENAVPDTFWRPWIEQQELMGGHHKTHKLVFEIEEPVVELAPEPEPPPMVPPKTAKRADPTSPQPTDERRGK